MLYVKVIFATCTTQQSEWCYCRRSPTNIWPLWEVKLMKVHVKIGIFVLLFGSKNSYYHGLCVEIELLHTSYLQGTLYFPNTWHDLPRTKVRNRAKGTSSSVCRCQELVRTLIFLLQDTIEKILVKNRAFSRKYCVEIELFLAIPTITTPTLGQSGPTTWLSKEKPFFGDVPRSS